jgi:hypothetical protein
MDNSIYTVLAKGWVIEHDVQDMYTVWAPDQRACGSLARALDTGVLSGRPYQDITIPPVVMRALARHGRAIECTPAFLRNVALGEYLLRAPFASEVYQRGAYDRAARRFSCVAVDDINKEIFLNPDSVVYIGFSF